MITLALILLLGLVGWTSAAFISKGKHQSEIKEEVKIMFKSIWSVLNSLKNLFYLLIKDSIKSAANEDLGIVRANVIEMVKSNSSKMLKKKGEAEDKAA